MCVPRTTNAPTREPNAAVEHAARTTFHRTQVPSNAARTAAGSASVAGAPAAARRSFSGTFTRKVITSTAA